MVSLPMQEKILILDFGSQFTQLIARRVRELNIYCEIHPFNKFPEVDASVKGIILSGSPYSVRQEDAPFFEFARYHQQLPILGVCYGAQSIAHFNGGEVMASSTRGCRMLIQSPA
jgi:GMP synthase (glutamine-hydrolysing)